MWTSLAYFLRNYYLQLQLFERARYTFNPHLTVKKGARNKFIFIVLMHNIRKILGVSNAAEWEIKYLQTSSKLMESVTR